MKYIAVICGNNREFGSFVLDVIHDPKRANDKIEVRHGSLQVGNTRYFNVGDVNQMRGINLHDVVYYGTWINRKDLDLVKEIADSRRVALAVEAPGLDRIMSETLLAICELFDKKTLKKLEKVSGDDLLKEIDFPFEVEEFCRRNDKKLNDLRTAVLNCGLRSGKALVSLGDAKAILGSTPAPPPPPQRLDAPAVTEAIKKIADAEKELRTLPL